MEFEQIITLIQEVSGSELTQFQLEEGNLKISMKKEKKQIIREAAVTAPVTAERADAVTACEVESEKIAGNVITSPLVGVFYRAGSPDAEPFVEPGTQVKKGDTVAIVEAMKLMNEIESDFEGVIKDILVENGEAVEYGQPLFVIG